MAKVKSDGVIETQGDTAFEKPDTQELQRMGGGAVARAADTETVLGGLSGDMEEIEIKYPLLKIKNGKSKTPEVSALPDGTLYIGVGEAVADRGEAAEVVILSVRRYWKEYQKVYDPSAILDEKATKKAVLDFGGTTDSRLDPGKTEYRPAGEIRALVRKPEGAVSSLFGFEFGGADWAPVRMFVDKSAAQEVLPTLVQDITVGGLRVRGYLSGVYEFRTKERQFKNGNSTWVPKLRLTRFNTDEDVAKIKETFGGFASSAPTSDEE